MNIVAFGVFDGLHPGHVSFLTQAKALGGRLIVIVARDEVVRRLKNREPEFGVFERVRILKDSGFADEVIIGDEKEGSWEVLKTHKPDIIALGYDQVALKESLVLGEISPQLVVLEAYKPEQYKSSLLNRK